ncbi:hypothetical protein PHMEG_00033172 [Phytophthora megakarya]|uniref:Uncharacterized protein n=1 Tax=Phytophthora megakarya TaxID=4795 RepID=A0A225UVE3_9STRA|nr:hypothetical protein PHMEG_00033172 [Phytophthora megakarya]
MNFLAKPTVAPPTCAFGTLSGRYSSTYILENHHLDHGNRRSFRTHYGHVPVSRPDRDGGEE